MEPHYIVSVLTLLLYAVNISWTYDPSKCIQCRKSHLCNPPDCFCCRDTMPLSGSHKIPQMVFFTFDDAVTPTVASYYRELFDSSRLNPNGCPIKMTLFISHSNTVYSLVKEFYKKGMEIASHSVTHSHPSSTTFPKEAKKQKENLATKAGIPEEDIKGWRSPFLEPLGDTQPDVLKSLGYKYDATLTVNKKTNHDKAVTPFTLDFGWPYDCKIKPCPKKTHKGFWEVPVVSVKDYMKQYDCVYVDGCNNPPPSEDLAYKFLWDNFQTYYSNNRAPMGINMHASWFYYPDRKAAMNRFIQQLVKMDDVFIVSISQVIEWLKQPTPLSHIKYFKPWQCDGGNTSSTISDMRQIQLQQPYDNRQREMLRQQQMAEEQRQQWQRQQLLMQQQSQNNMQRITVLSQGPGHTYVNPTQQPQPTSWQQPRTTLLQEMRNTRIPPVSPNFPLVRFWWRPPEGMNPEMQRQFQLRNNMQMQHVLHQRQQQMDIEQERLRSERMREQQRLAIIERNRLNELKRQEALRKEELARQHEQRRLMELKMKKADELKQKELARQKALEQEQMNARQQALEKKRIETLKHQTLLKRQHAEKQRLEQMRQQEAVEQQFKEQQQIKETKLRNMLKRNKLEKQRLEDIRRHEIVKLKGFHIRQEDSNLRTNTDPSHMSHKLDSLLRYNEPERIRQLGHLSLKDLVRLQVELRRRMSAETTAGTFTVPELSESSNTLRTLQTIEKSTDVKLESQFDPANILDHGHYNLASVNVNSIESTGTGSVEVKSMHSVRNSENVHVHVKTKLGITEPIVEKTDEILLRVPTTTSVPDVAYITYNILPSTKHSQAVVTPISVRDTTDAPPIIQPKIQRMWHINGDDLRQLSAPWDKWIPTPNTNDQSSDKNTLKAKQPDVKPTKVPVSKPKAFQFFSLDQIRTSKPIFSTETSQAKVHSPLGKTVHRDIISKQSEITSMNQRLATPPAVYQHNPVSIDIFKTGIPYRIGTVTTNKGLPFKINSHESISKTVSAPPPTYELATEAMIPTTTPAPVPINDIHVDVPMRASAFIPRPSQRISKFGSIFISPERSFIEPNLTDARVSIAQDKSCRQGYNCIAPACVCKSFIAPAGMQLKDVPQIIYISIDGSLNFHAYSKIRSLLSPGRRNPNNCRITGTLFISDSGSNYRMADSFKALGNEIAMMGKTFEPYTNGSVLESDIKYQKQKILARSDLVADDIKGWRSPAFAPTGDEQFTVLAKSNLYDSSLFVKESAKERRKLWPFTLDFGWKGGCEYGTCPQSEHPGVWEVPTMPFVGPDNTSHCEYTDGCSHQPITEDETMAYLMDNFNKFYGTNKAPFSIRLKQVWFHWYYRESLYGLMKFLDTVLSFGDVHVMSISKMLEWMKQPTPLKDIHQFKPWQC